MKNLLLHLNQLNLLYDIMNEYYRLKNLNKEK